MTSNIAYIIGAGGLGREIGEILSSQTNYVLYFVDDNVEMLNQRINGIELIGTIEDFIHSVSQETVNVIIAIGDGKVREKIYRKLMKSHLSKILVYPTLIDRNAIISPTAKINQGSIVMANSIVSTNASICEFSIINYNCVIGHDTEIQKFATVNPSVSIAGNNIIGEFTILGIGSKTIQERSIGSNSIVAAGSIVLRDIENNVLAFGSPARAMRKLT